MSEARVQTDLFDLIFDRVDSVPGPPILGIRQVLDRVRIQLLCFVADHFEAGIASRRPQDS